MSMTQIKPVNLDAEFAEMFANASKTVKYKNVTLFGRDWRVTTSTNVFSAVAGSMGEADAFISMLSNVVHPDERADFRKALMSIDGMDVDMLMQILSRLMEVAAERPTKSPSASSAGSTRARTKRQSSVAK